MLLATAMKARLYRRGWKVFKDTIMNKEQFLTRMMEIIPDNAEVLFASVTILTEDFKTLNYDTDSDEVE